MKIAILTNAYPPDGKGGAERIALLQAEGLASRGHDVSVWAPWESTSHRVIESSSRVRVIRFPSRFSALSKRNALSRLFFHLGDLSPRNDVAREIVVWKPDVLITHNLTGCGIGSGAKVQKSWVKWIHVLHDVQLTEPSGQVRASQQSSNQTIKQSFWRSFWSSLRRQSFGTPDVLVSPSKWLLDWHAGYGFHGKKEVVLPNPVEMGEVRERTLHHPAKIAYIGRLSEDKGFGDVLKMIPKLDAATVGRIVVVGDGPLAINASSLNDSRVDLRGALDHDGSRRVIAEADLLIAPSRILENQPTVILEAMAEGTPVIATDVGGVRELLDGTGVSILAVTDNLGERLAYEAKAILGDTERWATISRVLRRRAEERHRTDRYPDRLLSLL